MEEEIKKRLSNFRFLQDPCTETGKIEGHYSNTLPEVSELHSELNGFARSKDRSPKLEFFTKTSRDLYDYLSDDIQDSIDVLRKEIEGSKSKWDERSIPYEMLGKAGQISYEELRDMDPETVVRDEGLEIKVNRVGEGGVKGDSLIYVVSCQIDYPSEENLESKEPIKDSISQNDVYRMSVVEPSGLEISGYRSFAGSLWELSTPSDMDEEDLELLDVLFK
ncbi:MAG: hypothetical protein ACLFS3_00875 [Candidatus Aenigmatarchaeota archaeon]